MKREGTKDVLALEELYKEAYKEFLYLVGDQRISKLGHLIKLEDQMDEGGWVHRTINDIKSMPEIGDKREYISTVLGVLSEAAELMFYYKMMS